MQRHFADSLFALKGDAIDRGVYLAHVGQRGGGLACRGTRQERLHVALDGFGVPLIGDIAAPPPYAPYRGW